MSFQVMMAIGALFIIIITMILMIVFATGITYF